MASNSLRGKVIAVTGGASGIGLGIVQKLIALEAKVAIADITPSPPKEIEGAKNVTYSVVDVSSREQVHEWVQQTVEKFGRLDGMCANAGICPYEGGIVPDDVYQRVFAVCTTGVWNCGTEAYWQFKKQGGGGVVINTSSGAGLRPVKGLAVYSAAKAAVIGLTRAWALDWAVDKIRVNSLSPGLTSSGMQRATFEKFGAFGANLEAGVPMGRMGQPSELADSVIFLLGDTATFITGTILVCDGGSHCADA